MVIIQLLTWWYGPGWRRAASEARLRMVRVSHLFSLPVLIRTLGAPWRRIITYPGASLDDKLRALGDNLVSRVIGFTVRMLVLIAAGLVLFLTLCLGVIIIVLWPLVPLVVIVLLIKGIIG